MIAMPPPSGPQSADARHSCAHPCLASLSCGRRRRFPHRTEVALREFVAAVEVSSVVPGMGNERVHSPSATTQDDAADVVPRPSLPERLQTVVKYAVRGAAETGMVSMSEVRQTAVRGTVAMRRSHTLGFTVGELCTAPRAVLVQL